MSRVEITSSCVHPHGSMRQPGRAACPTASVWACFSPKEFYFGNKYILLPFIGQKQAHHWHSGC